VTFGQNPDLQKEIAPQVTIPGGLFRFPLSKGSRLLSWVCPPQFQRAIAVSRR